MFESTELNSFLENEKDLIEAEFITSFVEQKDRFKGAQLCLYYKTLRILAKKHEIFIRDFCDDDLYDSNLSVSKSWLAYANDLLISCCYYWSCMGPKLENQLHLFQSDVQYMRLATHFLLHAVVGLGVRIFFGGRGLMEAVPSMKNMIKLCLEQFGLP